MKAGSTEVNVILRIVEIFLEYFSLLQTAQTILTILMI